MVLIFWTIGYNGAGSIDGQCARLIKEDLCVLMFVSCRILYVVRTYHFVFNFFLKHGLAHVPCPLVSCPHVSCCGPCHAMPKIKKARYTFSFNFLRKNPKLLAYFFKPIYFFRVYLPLVKLNKNKNSRLKYIFNNNKLITVIECNINYYIKPYGIRILFNT